MSLTKPSRLFINNSKRPLQDFPDQFSIQLPAPIQGLTRLTVESVLIEYNPLHPNFPPYTNQLDVSVSDLSALVEIEIPTEVDWNTYVVSPETSWPKNFQQFVNDALSSAGSSVAITIDLADTDGLPGFLKFTSSVTGNIEFLGQSTLANVEQSIMERLGLSYRFAALGAIPELTIGSTGRATFIPTSAGTNCPGNFILGRTGSIYLLTDLDNGAQSDANIQNILGVIPIRAGIGLGDIVEGEDTNSITTSVNPTSDFNRLRILLFDDNYQPLEMREEQRTIIEFHFGYDRGEALHIA